MGGEDKEKNITKASGSRDHVKDVFDTSMSRLLQDFSSAELFSNTSEVPKGASYCPDSDCETVVSSMKHLHLRRPVFTKQKKSRMCAIKKKNLPNTLNLAIAACGYQRPIVWPARLSCHSEKCHSNVLRPSRLPIKKKATFDQVTKSSINAYSSDIPKLAQKQDHVIFSNASALDFSSLSFSSLSEQTTENVKVNNNLQEQGCSSTPSFKTTVGPAKSLCKRRSGSGVPPVKFARTLVEAREPGTSQTIFLDYRNSGYSYSCTPGYDSTHKHSLVGGGIIARTPVETVATNQTAALSSPSSLETLAILNSTIASCDQPVPVSLPDNLRYSSSQELSLEEANVNELASYFEDLLHIPRKMSIMAEMMYT